MSIHVDYKTHRQIWKSEQFLRHFFGVNKNTPIANSPGAKNFLNQIKEIPEKPTYYIIGYGSLLDKADTARTVTAKTFELGQLHGYRRIFNVGYQTALLNVAKTDDQNDIMYVSYIGIGYEDLPHFIAREGYYNIVPIELQNGEIGLISIAKSSNENYWIEPQLNYLHLCLSGMAELGGAEGVKNFLEQTLCYSPAHGRIVNVRKYLNNMNLIDHMLRNSYSSR